jgi:hypothetical protein
MKPNWCFLCGAGLVLRRLACRGATFLWGPPPMVYCYAMRVVALVVCTAGLASSLAAANCVPYVGAPILQLLIAMTGPPHHPHPPPPPHSGTWAIVPRISLT